MKLQGVKFGAGPKQGIVAEYVCEKCGMINNVVKAGGDVNYEWPEYDEYRCFACEVELSTLNA